MYVLSGTFQNKPTLFKINADISLIFQMQFLVNHWQTCSRAGNILSPDLIQGSGQRRKGAPN